jgi:hypothetical protein
MSLETCRKLHNIIFVMFNCVFIFTNQNMIVKNSFFYTHIEISYIQTGYFRRVFSKLFSLKVFIWNAFISDGLFKVSTCKATFIVFLIQTIIICCTIIFFNGGIVIAYVFFISFTEFKTYML